MAMYDVSIPDNELNEFDLPRVCIVTGAQENVVFKKVQFQWYPPWIGITVLCSPIIFAVVALILMKRSKGTLPFTEEAYWAWQKGKIALTLAILGGIVAFIAAMVFFGQEQGALGGLLLLVSIAAPIAVGVTLFRGRGPKVTSIREGRTYLKIPSADAAARITQHLSQPNRAPRPQALA